MSNPAPSRRILLRRPFFAFCCVSLLWVGGGPPLDAQSPRHAPAPVVVPTDSSAVHTLTPIGVVARRSGYAPRESRSSMRTATSLRDTPQTVTVVSRDLIDDQAMQGLGDALQYIPGARMGQGEGNRDQPTIRGNASTSSFFVDGIRDDVQYVRDLYNVDRVEGLMGANALIFGRGASGGVINRVTKEAGRTPVREIRLSAGSFGSRRGAVDVGQPVARNVAVRANAMFEHSDLFRRGATIERYGVNPTVTVTPGAATRITASAEHFNDDRTADRGIPSFGGAPVDVNPATFFGNAQLSRASARVTSADAAIEHRLSDAVTLHSRVRYAAYDKFYQNIFPGAVNAARTTVRISAYNDATDRQNLFNQTEVTARVRTGDVRHTLLTGVAVGRQATDNFRNTGYFNNATTSVDVPLSDPVVTTPVSFRQGERDADNHAEATTASWYVQDQAEITQRWRLVAGLGIERFTVDVRNNRRGETIGRVDVMVSPRGGLVFRATDDLALYGSYGVAALPSAGDQFSSLDATAATLEPETFENWEAGLKWDAADRLAITATAYQLDRNKSRAPDPVDASRSVQTGSQRSRGVEVGIQGSVVNGWQVAGGYAFQQAEITGHTSAAAVGAVVPLVPRHSLALWNRVRLGAIASVGLGVTHQGESFAAFDNAVSLPAFTRFDAAAFVRVTANLELQANVENLFDTQYYLTSHNNNNISPGSPRAVRLSLTTSF